MAEFAKFAKLCVNCDHLGTEHAKINIQRDKVRSWSFMPCRKCKEEGRNEICEDFKPEN